jgi:hypothetical protein
MTYQRLTGTKIANWLSANYTTVSGSRLTCVASPPVIPDSPDEIVVVTLLPGTGHDHEKAFEVRSFQIRCRSMQNTPWIAEANSMGIDSLLNSMMMPWQPDGAHVIELGWTGGGPSPLPADDAANRYSWVCSYYGKSATGY